MSASMEKVELVRERPARWDAPAESAAMSLRFALPFFFSPFASRVHRIRSGIVHFWAGEWTHTSFRLWCGQGGFLDEKKHKHSRVTNDPPNGYPVCGTCEGRARGAGQLESHTIAGRLVVFTPQR